MERHLKLRILAGAEHFNKDHKKGEAPTRALTCFYSRSALQGADLTYAISDSPPATKTAARRFQCR